MLCVGVCLKCVLFLCLIFGKPSSIEGSHGYFCSAFLLIVLTIWADASKSKVGGEDMKQVFMHIFPVDCFFFLIWVQPDCFSLCS